MPAHSLPIAPIRMTWVRLPWLSPLKWLPFILCWRKKLSREKATSLILKSPERGDVATGALRLLVYSYLWLAGPVQRGCSATCTPLATGYKYRRWTQSPPLIRAMWDGKKLYEPFVEYSLTICNGFSRGIKQDGCNSWLSKGPIPHIPWIWKSKVARTKWD